MAAEVRLSGVSCETYESLLAENNPARGIRMTYDNGDLEIVVLSVHHEEPNRTLATIVDVAVEEMDRDIRRIGSTTIKWHDVLKGFEPDSCYYIGDSVSRLGREIDFASGPPPDLVIEVDTTSNSMQKFPLFGAVGIREVWRFDGERVRFYCLGEGQKYSEVGESAVLPPLTAEAVSGFLEKSAGMRNTQWLRLVREWIRQAR